MIVPTRTDYLHHLRQLLPPHPVCVEIGVHEGIFSAQLLTILQPSLLVLIDPWETSSDPALHQGDYNYDTYNRRYWEGKGPWPTAYSNQQEYERVQQRYANDPRVQINRKYSFQAVDDYPDGYFDLVYIDGCHLYEAVTKDLIDWYPKLRPGGIHAGHDYVNVPWLGVYPAVNEFCRQCHQTIILQSQFPGPEGGGDWALAPIPS